MIDNNKLISLSVKISALDRMIGRNTEAIPRYFRVEEMRSEADIAREELFDYLSTVFYKMDGEPDLDWCDRYEYLLHQRFKDLDAETARKIFHISGLIKKNRPLTTRVKEVEFITEQILRYSESGFDAYHIPHLSYDDEDILKARGFKVTRQEETGYVKISWS